MPNFRIKPNQLINLSNDRGLIEIDGCLYRDCVGFNKIYKSEIDNMIILLFLSALSLNKFINLFD